MLVALSFPIPQTSQQWQQTVCGTLVTGWHVTLRPLLVDSASLAGPRNVLLMAGLVRALPTQAETVQSEGWLCWPSWELDSSK